MSLEGKTVWITGASSGIGLEIARHLAEAGARVYGSARSAEPMRALAEAQGNFIPLPLDVTDPAATEKAVETLIEQAGGLDLVVLNAAVYAPGPTRELDIETARSHFEVNVLGVINALSLVLPHMRERRRGRIAIVASVAGYSGLPNAGVYGATKAALINLAESLRTELTGSGVVIQVINPGFVDTPMTRKNDFSMPMIISSERAARIMVKGLQSDRFEISFPWLFVTLLKILRILPYSLYFPLVRRMVR